MTELEPGKTALFPLGQPLYPDVVMKLRIFEQRYLKLVRDTMSSGAPFGVVPIIRGNEVGSAPDFFHWGTLVNIIDFNQQPDGLLGIAIRGNRRFRVLDHSVREDGLIVAGIETLASEPEEAAGSDEQDLMNLLDDLVTGLKAEEYFTSAVPTLSGLSWRLATLMPLPAPVKMSLLKEDDPLVRLDIIRECLVDLTGNDRPAN